jgi:L-aspartate oxidase
VFGRRAALAALDEPAVDGRADTDEPTGAAAIAPVRERTRQALWRHAGIERSESGLRDLLRDPHPLARMVAHCALLRQETRGTHARGDHPQRDERLDGQHAVIAAGTDSPQWQPWQ